MSDSPPSLHPRSSLPRVGDCGFENAIEIDLFDGMGRGYCHVQNCLNLVIIISCRFMGVVDLLIVNPPSRHSFYSFPWPP